MKAKIAILILIIFCFAQIKPLLPFVEYYANYEYISEVLCVNKDKPLSTCNGKCYLSQQLEKTQETEKQDQNIPTEKQERIPLLICNCQFSKFVVTNSSSKNLKVFYQFSIKDLTLEPPSPPPKS